MVSRSPLASDVSGDWAKIKGTLKSKRTRKIILINDLHDNGMAYL
jgi:hypothetical protein